jgi:hypothetical protein
MDRTSCIDLIVLLVYKTRPLYGFVSMRRSGFPDDPDMLEIGYSSDRNPSSQLRPRESGPNPHNPTAIQHTPPGGSHWVTPVIPPSETIATVPSYACETISGINPASPPSRESSTASKSSSLSSLSFLASTRSRTSTSPTC